MLPYSLALAVARLPESVSGDPLAAAWGGLSVQSLTVWIKKVGLSQIVLVHVV
ncbi:hypothetical protein [Rhodovulum sp. P5]|uniref:hypothetical protein n=1 Tax=Rhodovulum sp. P5 TaxID=1564506 RepID=UPI0012EB72C5|nr:hypothetical protein [Rhodovulum sp. P5]